MVLGLVPTHWADQILSYHRYSINFQYALLLNMIDWSLIFAAAIEGNAKLGSVFPSLAVKPQWVGRVFCLIVVLKQHITKSTKLNIITNLEKKLIRKQYD